MLRRSVCSPQGRPQLATPLHASALPGDCPRGCSRGCLACLSVIDSDPLVVNALAEAARGGWGGPTASVPSAVAWLREVRETRCAECCLPLVGHSTRCRVVFCVSHLNYESRTFKLCDGCRSEGYRRLVDAGEARAASHRMEWKTRSIEAVMKRGMVRSVSMPYRNETLMYAYEIADALRAEAVRTREDLRLLHRLQVGGG